MSIKNLIRIIAVAVVTFILLPTEITAQDVTENAKRLVYSEGLTEWRGADIFVSRDLPDGECEFFFFEFLPEGGVRLIPPVEYILEDGDHLGGYYAGVLSVPEKIEYGGEMISVVQIDGFFRNGVSELILPSGLRSICNSIESCGSLVKISFNDELEEISGVRNCPYLQECRLPSALKYVGDNSMMNTGLKSIILPEGVEKVGNGAFSYNYVLEELDLCKLVETGDDAFSHLQSLKRLLIPETVRSLGSGSFSYCCGLEEIEFASGNIDYGNECFLECNMLQRVIVRSLEPDICPFPMERMSKITLFVPEDSESAYRKAMGWRNAKSIVTFSEM